MDAFEELIFSMILSRQSELLALAEMGDQVQVELSVVCALLHLIRSGHGQIPVEQQQDRGPMSLQ